MSDERMRDVMAKAFLVMEIIRLVEPVELEEAGRPIWATPHPGSREIVDHTSCLPITDVHYFSSVSGRPRKTPLRASFRPSGVI